MLGGATTRRGCVSPRRLTGPTELVRAGPTDDIKERDRPDIAALRDTVRRVLVAWVAITRAGTAPGEFGVACDRVLLSATAWEDLLRPVAELRARIGRPPSASEDATP